MDSLKMCFKTHFVFLYAFIFLPVFLVQASEHNPDAKRSLVGLQVLYDFSSTDGNTVKDRSGVGEPLDLTIEDRDAVRWNNGALEVLNPTLIRSKNSPEKLIRSVQWTGEITVEAWIQPASKDAAGPARIISFSKNSSQRNFTLGQDGEKYEMRFRTTTTSSNGIPSINTEGHTFSTELSHIVYTRDRTGKARFYINNQLVKEGMVSGETQNWDNTHQFVLANEIDNGRPWLGAFLLVAVYNRELLPSEIEQHFLAGANPNLDTSLLALQNALTQSHLFDDKIAPIIASHCLECHDAGTKQGGLDLSKKSQAFTGGNSGEPIIAGKPDESMIWTMVNMESMPLNRTPLSQQEKDVIKQWINEGAEWTLEVLEPEILVHSSSSGSVWLQRLTVPEYIATVKSTVDVDIENEALSILPKDMRADGFSNTAYNLNIDLKHIEAYTKLAEIAVQKMDITAFMSRFTDPKKLKEDDMPAFVGKMGKWILRGPLSEHEINVFRGIASTASASGSSREEAVGYMIEAMLQSPRFIYRIENQRGDGNLWYTGEYELASRLSYILWGTSPDQELFNAAESGKLSKQSEIQDQLKRMLQEEKAVTWSKQFIAEWLNLNRLDNLRPNRERFPDWNPELAKDMHQETIAFFHDVVWKQNLPLSRLMNAQVTYVTPRLAKHYNMPAIHEEMNRYDLTNVPGRGGLLTHGSVLTVGGDEASMVTRGLFVFHDVLRGKVKDPPPCVDTTPVPSQPGLTQRNAAEQRIENPACAGCHSKFEPLAFGLEKFDGLGSYHDKDEYGNNLRDDGEIVFPDTGETISYNSSKELMDLLAKSGRVSETMTWKLTQFSLGRPLTPEDMPVLKQIHQNAQNNGGTYSDTISAIVMSDLVLKTRTEAYQ